MPGQSTGPARYSGRPYKWSVAAVDCVEFCRSGEVEEDSLSVWGRTRSGITFPGLVQISPDSTRRCRKRAVLRQHASVKGPDYVRVVLRTTLVAAGQLYSRGLRPLQAKLGSRSAHFSHDVVRAPEKLARDLQIRGRLKASTIETAALAVCSRQNIGRNLP